MPIRDFSGQTFVAFTDISGFKSMMTDGKRGPAALNSLYQAGYEVLSGQADGEPHVEGFFISDCGVLFSRDHDAQPLNGLDRLLRAVETLNRKCFEQAVSLTTSVAWGEFSYHQRIEVQGIEKNPIYGNAYVAAFVDNESAAPRLYPNECRIIRRGLPEEVSTALLDESRARSRRLRSTDKHLYFEWMRVSQ